MSTIEPGWYKDPADPTTQRWWDGEGWLGEALSADVTPPPGPPGSTAPPAITAPPARTADPAVGATAPGLGAPPAGALPTSASTPTPAAPYPAPPGPTAWPPGAPPVAWPGGYAMPVPVPRPHGFLLAAPGARFMARMVDIAVVAVLCAIANAWFAIEFWRHFRPLLDWAMANPGRFEGLPQPSPEITTLLMLMCAVITAVWFAYEVPASANSGQTLGKRMFGIKVVKVESDGRLGFGRSLGRWSRLGLPTLFWYVCLGIPFLLQIIDCLFVATDRPLHQALHDKSARTVVVQVPRAGRPETARLTPNQSESTAGGRHADPR